MDKKQLRELLDTLGSQLKADIETAQAELKNAATITAQINGLFTKSTEFVAKFEDPESGFNVTLEKATVDTTKLHDTVTAAETTLTTIQNSVATVQQQVATMQTAYAEFEAVKTRIDEPTTGLAGLLASSTQLATQIRNSSTEVNTNTESIKQSLTTVQQQVATMQTAYAEFEAVKTRINDPATGLQATLDSSQKVKAAIDVLQAESETVSKDISRYKDSAAKNIASIEAIKSDSEKKLEEITNNQTESESLKTNIATIFKLVSQGAHANYFDKRRSSLVRASWGWLVASMIFITIAVLIGLHTIVPLTKLDRQGHSTGTAQELIVRFSVISPFLLLGAFSATNYSRERRLAEHYAFRAVSTLSIEGSLLVLTRSLKDHSSVNKDDEIIDFAVSTMRLIYSEPQEHSKSTRLHLRGGNKVAEVGAELNQTLGDLSKNLGDSIAKDPSAK